MTIDDIDFRRLCREHMCDAGGRFIDAKVAELLGRPRPALPNYIDVINIFYRMGRQPRLDYIDNDNRLAGAENFDEFARKVAFSVGGPWTTNAHACMPGSTPVPTGPGGVARRFVGLSWPGRSRLRCPSGSSVAFRTERSPGYAP